jgi:glucokinase
MLAADVGATKVALAIVSRESGPRQPLALAYYRAADHADLESIVRDFLGACGHRPDRACLGVPGPVIDHRAELTNLGWTVDERRMAAATGIGSVHLMNDAHATATAIPYLLAEDLRTLHEGEAVARGAVAVLAVGTGVGEAFLTWAGTRYAAHPSEGGHADLAPVVPDDLDLWACLRGRFGHVSAERVCSGRGVMNVYACLRDSGPEAEPQWLAEALAAATDPTPVIVSAALEPGTPCPLCRASLETFARILGAEAGNFALKVLATGGVYLAGGVAPHVLPFLEGPAFREAFVGKGRYRDLIEHIPMHVVINPRAGLLGAAHAGLALED